MAKPSMIIADTNITCCSLFADCFKSHGFHVLPPLSNGVDVVRVVSEQKVDVLLLDLVLHRIDGCAVLERIQKLDPAQQPHTFVHTALTNDQMIEYALRHGARYFFAKMTECEVVFQRVVDMIQMEGILERVSAGSRYPFTDETVRDSVTQLIRAVGVPAHIKGYHHLRAAIEYLISQRSVVGETRYYGVTTHIYPRVASSFGTSPQRIERNIRNAIEIAWTRGNIDTLHEIFGYTVNDKKGRPTNSEFIAMLADRTIITLSAM